MFYFPLTGFGALAVKASRANHIVVDTESLQAPIREALINSCF